MRLRVVIGVISLALLGLWIASDALLSPRLASTTRECASAPFAQNLNNLVAEEGFRRWTTVYVLRHEEISGRQTFAVTFWRRLRFEYMVHFRPHLVARVFCEIAKVNTTGGPITLPEIARRIFTSSTDHTLTNDRIRLASCVVLARLSLPITPQENLYLRSRCDHDLEVAKNLYRDTG